MLQSVVLEESLLGQVSGHKLFEARVVKTEGGVVLVLLLGTLGFLQI